MTLWSTPHGNLLAELREIYVGLRRQERVMLVDALGRVHHFDRDEVTVIG